ncbi:MAG: endolytic transglycosylase MltG [Ezakiella sp.]|nr:endolytic transglycosylase MltG [Ezakiella sp.]MDY3946371.1 endolytic transglycosylase MltG [Ezakiella sp.]
MNKNAKWIVTILAILLVVGIVYFGVKSYFAKMYKPMDKKDTSIINVEIPEGSSLSTVAEILHYEGLIRNGTFFKSRVEELGHENDIQSGEFALSKSMSVNDIIEEITRKPEEVVLEGTKLVIPEGFERKLIAQRIEEMGLGSKEAFMLASEDKSKYEEEFPFLKELSAGQSLEGYLFPATYNILPDTSEEDIVRQMLGAFKLRMDANFPEGSYNNLSFNEIITLASIIEREIKVDDERPIAASVFYNRINQGMRLQSCATVQFILGERKPVLSEAETKIDSPFNTYINDGLPPSPIASPGMKSIMATINPAQTDYLFFVKTGEDGSHTFTKTYEEHLKSKENMIR